MKIFKTIYCRIWHIALKISVRFLPYRKVKIYDTLGDVKNILTLNNINNILIVTDKIIEQTEPFKKLIQDLTDNEVNFVVYNQTMPNPKTKAVVHAHQMFVKNDCKAVLSFGGGSSIDLAKGVLAKDAKPKKNLIKMSGLFKILKKTKIHIVIPTTAGSGSETTVTSVLTDSDTHKKFTINDMSLIPHYAVLDYNVLLSLPQNVLCTTGMDALTHAIEAYIGKATTRQTRKDSLQAIELIFNNLEKAYDTKDSQSLQNMLLASHLAGRSFTRAFVGYVHAIAHTLGGKYDTPHGLANAVILPIMLKRYGNAINSKSYKIAKYLGWEVKSKKQATTMLIEKIESMNQKFNLPTKFDFIKNKDISAMVEIADKESNPLYPVPKVLTKNELAQMYKIIQGKVK